MDERGEGGQSDCTLVFSSYSCARAHTHARRRLFLPFEELLSWQASLKIICSYAARRSSTTAEALPPPPPLFITESSTVRERERLRKYRYTCKSCPKDFLKKKGERKIRAVSQHEETPSFLLLLSKEGGWPVSLLLEEDTEITTGNKKPQGKI